MKSPSPPRVVTLTLHPAIDRVVRIDTMLPGGTFNGREQLTVPAGKGVNTARVLRELCGKQQPILAVVWAGENEADFFRTELLALAGIECAVCQRPVRTRFAQTYLEAGGRETHIKESMPPPEAAEKKQFLEFLGQTLQRGDIVALCGSAPPGMSTADLKRVFQIALARGARAIVADTNGPALAAAADSKIDLLKGNAAELSALLPSEGKNPNDALEPAGLRALLAGKAAPQTILMTMGSEGAVLATRTQLLRCKTTPEQMNHAIVSTTGCGDAATAGVLWSLLDPEDTHEKRLARAVACGAAKTLSADPGKISLKSVRRFVRYSLTTPINAS